ncbi:MAG TPA: chalcone isomerase family protein [Propionicimonas sp.]|jgi:hypothetical protein
MRAPTLAAAALCWALASWATAAKTRELSGVRMPETVTVAGRQLRLNGMGLSKKKVLFVAVKVDVVGLYLESPTHDPQVAIASDEPKRISIVMVRDVNRDAFVKAVEAGMERNTGAAMPALRQRLDRLERALPNLRKGDVLDFTYLPGVGTLARSPLQEMAIPGKDFADALFSVWLGPRATDPGLKQGLLGL